MTSLDHELSEENSETLRRNLSALCVVMKDSDDFSKYDAVLDKEVDEAEEKYWNIKAEDVAIPPELDQNESHSTSSDTDEIPPTPSQSQKKKLPPSDVRKYALSQNRSEADEIPSTPTSKLGSPPKRMKTAPSSFKKASSWSKQAKFTDHSSEMSSTTNTLSTNVFNADEVISKELESLVPKNLDGTQSKRAISKYTSDDPKKKSLGLTRRVRKKPTQTNSEPSSSQSIKQYFTPVRKTKTKPTIDELLNTPPDDCGKSVSPSTWASLDEMTKELKKLCKMSRDKSSQFEEDRKHRNEYKESSLRMRHELHSKMSPDGMKKWILSHKEFVNKVWSGEIESSRYEAFHRSTEARHGLLYHMITHPYTDQQIEAVLEALTQEWMYTKDLLSEHSDFVWKVVLPEVLIKIYMETFELTDKGEAEKRIASTPLDPDDENNHW